MGKTKTYIFKVRINKVNGQRTVTIPKEAVDIKEYVKVKNHDITEISPQIISEDNNEVAEYDK